MNYSIECKAGRDYAASEVSRCAETGDLPRLVRTIREMAADESGIGVGFLFAAAGRLIADHQATSI